MKRVGYIYEKIISVENCRTAIINASKGKRNRKYVKCIIENLDYYAKDLSIRLQVKCFTTPYKKEIIIDGSSRKQREIQVPKFYPDQCAHHAIMLILLPYLYKCSYPYSCANIKGRGLSKAAKYMSKAMRSGNVKYCSKYDISKFYPSVDNDILKKLFRTKIKDKKFLEILDTVVDTSKGLPIGNYTSPWFAELYLQDLDRYIKEDLGVKYYVRYADDLVLMGRNKRKLISYEDRIINYLWCNRKLKIKDNYQTFLIYNNNRGRKIDFIGRCYGIDICTIRKRVALSIMRQSRFIRRLQAQNLPIYVKTASGFISRMSAFLFTDSYEMKKKYVYSINITKLKGVISRDSKRKCETRDLSYRVLSTR